VSSKTGVLSKKRKERKMILTILAFLVSVYTVIAICIVFHFNLKEKYGLEWYNNEIHRFAYSNTAGFLEFYSYIVVVMWLVISLPLVDLLTFQFFSSFSKEGFQTYFGLIKWSVKNIYILVVFFNVIGAVLSLKIGSIAGMLRGGRVYFTPRFKSRWITE
jgi:hypothetical protein